MEKKCKENDLVIADASEDYADIGKCIEIINLENQMTIAGLHTFLARPDKMKMQLGFSAYLVKSWLIRKTPAAPARTQISTPRMACAVSRTWITGVTTGPGDLNNLWNPSRVMGTR